MPYYIPKTRSSVFHIPAEWRKALGLSKHHLGLIHADHSILQNFVRFCSMQHEPERRSVTEQLSNFHSAYDNNDNSNDQSHSLGANATDAPTTARLQLSVHILTAGSHHKIFCFPTKNQGRVIYLLFIYYTTYTSVMSFSVTYQRKLK